MDHFIIKPLGAPLATKNSRIWELSAVWAPVGLAIFLCLLCCELSQMKLNMTWRLSIQTGSLHSTFSDTVSGYNLTSATPHQVVKCCGRELTQGTARNSRVCQRAPQRSDSHDFTPLHLDHFIASQLVQKTLIRYWFSLVARPSDSPRRRAACCEALANCF